MEEDGDFPALLAALRQAFGEQRVRCRRRMRGEKPNRHMVEHFASGPLRRVLGGMLAVDDLKNVRGASRLTAARWRCGVVRARIPDRVPAPLALRSFWPAKVQLSVEHVEQLALALEDKEELTLPPRERGLHTLVSAVQRIYAIIARPPAIRVGEAGSESLSQLVVDAKMVRSLNLTNNQIGDEGCFTLAAILPKQLAGLDLTGNLICVNGFKAILKALPLETIRLFSISNNQIGDAGCVALAKALPHMPRMADLDITNNQVSLEAFTTLMAALPRKTLTSFNSSWNPIGTGGGLALASVLPELEKLTSLDICWNRIGDEGVADLAVALLAMPVMTSLDVSRNMITDKGCFALAGGAIGLKSLRTLNVNGNKITGSGCTALAAVLPTLAHLTMLDISWNQIGCDGCNVLNNALPKATVLANLNLNTRDREQNCAALTEVFLQLQTTRGMQVAWHRVNKEKQEQIDVHANRVTGMAVVSLVVLMIIMILRTHSYGVQWSAVLKPPE